MSIAGLFQNNIVRTNPPEPFQGASIYNTSISAAKLLLVTGVVLAIIGAGVLSGGAVPAALAVVAIVLHSTLGCTAIGIIGSVALVNLGLITHAIAVKPNQQHDSRPKATFAGRILSIPAFTLGLVLAVPKVVFNILQLGLKKADMYRISQKDKHQEDLIRKSFADGIRQGLVRTSVSKPDDETDSQRDGCADVTRKSLPNRASSHTANNEKDRCDDSPRGSCCTNQKADNTSGWIIYRYGHLLNKFNNQFENITLIEAVFEGVLLPTKWALQTNNYFGYQPLAKSTDKDSNASLSGECTKEPYLDDMIKGLNAR